MKRIAVVLLLLIPPFLFAQQIKLEHVEPPFLADRI